MIPARAAHNTARRLPELEMTVAAALPVAPSGQYDPAVFHRTGKTELLCTLDERFDDRGKPVYVIMRAGVELTSRWTRSDADRELERRNIPIRPRDREGVQTAI